MTDLLEIAADRRMRLKELVDKAQAELDQIEAFIGYAKKLMSQTKAVGRSGSEALVTAASQPLAGAGTPRAGSRPQCAVNG